MVHQLSSVIRGMSAIGSVRYRRFHCIHTHTLSLTLTLSTASGIKFLNSKKIVHRDLKPENILLKRVGESQVNTVRLSIIIICTFTVYTCTSYVNKIVTELPSGSI